MNHRVEHLLSNEVDTVVPVEAEHGLRRATVQCSECRGLQLRYVRFQINCDNKQITLLYIYIKTLITLDDKIDTVNPVEMEFELRQAMVQCCHRQATNRLDMAE